MKKLLVLILALLFLFPSASAEETIINLREILSEATLVKGTYTQIGQSGLQFWIPNEGFTQLEIPQEEEDKNVYYFLSFDENPVCWIVVEAGTTDETFDELFSALTAEDMNERIKKASTATVNGLQALSYMDTTDPNAVVWVYTYIVDGIYVRFIVNRVSNNDAFDNRSTQICCSLERIPADQKE